MPTIYVAGPVSRSRRAEVPEWVQKCYAAARELGNDAELKIVLLMPEGESSLDAATPRDFHRQISGRISSANAVITVQSGDDSATAVESCLASAYEKKQLILTADESKLPRILRGQPGVMAIVECNQWTDPTFAIRQFVKQF